MPHWRQQISRDNPNLHWWDIADRSPLAVTIDGWFDGEVKDDDGATKAKTFLKLKDEKKPWGINVTCATIITALVGTGNLDKWKGKQISLRIASQHSGTPAARARRRKRFVGPS